MPKNQSIPVSEAPSHVRAGVTPLTQAKFRREGSWFTFSITDSVFKAELKLSNVKVLEDDGVIPCKESHRKVGTSCGDICNNIFQASDGWQQTDLEKAYCDGEKVNHLKVYSYQSSCTRTGCIFVALTSDPFSPCGWHDGRRVLESIQGVIDN